MSIDLSPPVKLWTPPNPAIIRASDIPKTYAEAKGIATKAVLPGSPASLAALVPGIGASAAVAGTAEETEFDVEVVDFGTFRNQNNTLTGRNFGAAHATRFHVLAISWLTLNTTPSSVSVGGQTATERVGGSGNATTQRIYIYTIEGVTGTSGNVVINRTSASAANAAAWTLYRIVNADNVVPENTLSPTGPGGAPSGSLTVSNGGVIIGSATVQRTSNYRSAAQASRIFPSGGSITITADGSSGSLVWTNLDQNNVDTESGSVSANAGGIGAAAWKPA